MVSELMSLAAKNKSIILKPSWKAYFGWYLISFLTIPVLGVGLLILYFVRKKHISCFYKITDTQISSVDSKYQRNIDLVNIDQVELQQNRFRKKLDIGTLVLHTSSVRMEMTGLDSPQQLKELLERAIVSEKKRLHQKVKRKSREPQFEPGTMDRMDYLTGLWQEGLISDEDFEKERKYFE